MYGSPEQRITPTGYVDRKITTVGSWAVLKRDRIEPTIRNTQVRVDVERENK